jgi:hypothetical protein
MGKGKKAILIGLGLVVVLYVAESLYISSKVYSVIKASYASYGESGAYEDIVSDEIFARMCYRKGYSISSKDVSGAKETNKLSFPFTYHYFVCGSSTYKYSYFIYDESGKMAGGAREILVTVSVCLQKGRWVITDYYEAP